MQVLTNLVVKQYIEITFKTTGDEGISFLLVIYKA